jgi:hypothetical protein
MRRCRLTPRIGVGVAPAPRNALWVDAVRAFGQERADRRASADAEATRQRDDAFGALRADIERHLDRAPQAIHDAEQKWTTAPELDAWREAKAALLCDAFAPLPARRSPRSPWPVTPCRLPHCKIGKIPFR